MLGVWLVMDDWRTELAVRLFDKGYKSHHIDQNGLVVQYFNEIEKSIISKILKSKDDRHKYVQDITLEEVEEYKEVPFNYIDMEAFKNWFNL